jgi:hypothetical protein
MSHVFVVLLKERNILHHVCYDCLVHKLYKISHFNIIQRSQFFTVSTILV